MGTHLEEVCPHCSDLTIVLGAGNGNLSLHKNTPAHRAKRPFVWFFGLGIYVVSFSSVLPATMRGFSGPYGDLCLRLQTLGQFAR